jgi:SAM-dependent methyltransferase
MNVDHENIHSNENQPQMYGQLAGWWALISAPEDYAEEAAFIQQALEGAVIGPLESLLELGSGGGNNASFLKQHCKLTLVDRSQGMLDASRRLNPECEHLLGDMRSLRLGRQFDAVLIHDAIMYMLDLTNLQAALDTAYSHTRPGGAGIFVPDCVQETFTPSTRHGGHDGEGRALRYLEWTYDPDPADTQFVTDFAFLLHEQDGRTSLASDRHVMGLFPRQAWLDCLQAAGYRAQVLVDTYQRDVFIGRRPQENPA